MVEVWTDFITTVVITKIYDPNIGYSIIVHILGGDIARQ